MKGLLKKIFGDKQEKDRKELQPIVDKTNEEFAKLSSLSDDQLRGKTAEFKQRISEYLGEQETELNDLKKKVEEDSSLSIDDKEQIYDRIDALTDEIDVKLEEVLEELMPEAFAVVKETARRWAENGQLDVEATDLDKGIAASRTGVEIKGDRAIWHKKWDAAGTEVEWNMVHYDVQLMGGAVLHKGTIAEMQTGEGKTLVATLPVYLNALAGKGVHLVTVNNYLARRDSQWMGPLYQFHGMTVACIDDTEPNSPQRQEAYKSDVVFGTNNEFGFDYLRDNMVSDINRLVQQKHHYAIIDEVDSVLIDDARTPLIISGPTPKGDEHEFYELKPRIEKLVNAQRRLIQGYITDAKKILKDVEEEEAGDKKEAKEKLDRGRMALLRSYRGLPKNKALIKFLSEPGIRSQLQKVENYYMQDQQKEMHKVDQELYFTIDEKHNQIELSEKGIDLISSGEDNNEYVLPDIGGEIAKIEKEGLDKDAELKKKDQLMRDYQVKAERIHTMNQLLKAYALFEKEVDYVVMDNKVKIVDEQTGRIMEGRRYSDGLHQAIEAKENVKVEAATQTYATITLQNFFRMYHKLAGMTGTAETEAKEFWDIYELDVVVVPTNRPIARADMNDMVYKTAREKYNAIIDQVEEYRNEGRPILVGTTTVESSELLSRMLKMRKVPHNVLNAKYHAKEADIVAEAGRAGTVTIATNMAGRGTDIKLGEGVKEAGGLAIIGTERHESRRIDRQLRGRAGRQGDPGSSQFYVSLEDNLMRLFGSERIARLMDRMGLKEGEVIQHSMITKSIERAQKKVEENNFGIRKRLLEYDDVMNAQRNAIYKRRRNALYGERLELDISNIFREVATGLIEETREMRDYEGFQMELIRTYGIEPPVKDEDELVEADPSELTEKIYSASYEGYKRKSEHMAKQSQPVIENIYQREQPEDSIKKVAIPVSDGTRSIQIGVSLLEAHEKQCKNIPSEIEKGITLAYIDKEWKEHLREMDDLRQSVQHAQYEQKDPLLVYKLESFDLFKKMVDNVNQEIVSFLTKASLPVVEEVKTTQAPPEDDDLAKAETSHSELPAYATAGGGQSQQPQQQPNQPQQRQKVQPIVKDDPKIGRNDKVVIYNIQTNEKKELKFKKAEPLLKSGQWRLMQQ